MNRLTGLGAEIELIGITPPRWLMTGAVGVTCVLELSDSGRWTVQRSPNPEGFQPEEHPTLHVAMKRSYNLCLGLSR